MKPQPEVAVKSAESHRELWIPCSNCGRSTSHKVLTVVNWNCDEGDGYWEDVDYLTAFCQGCKTVCFCRAFTSAADGEGDLTVYPGRIEGRPVLIHRYSLPQRVRTIYLEAHKALCDEQPILAGIGIRAIVEAVCAEKAATGSDLQKKIDDLATKGHITVDGAAILHSLRFMGNAAAHETKAHTVFELSTAFDVVEHLLTGVYILPKEAAKKLPQKTS